MNRHSLEVASEANCDMITSMIDSSSSSSRTRELELEGHDHFDDR